MFLKQEKPEIDDFEKKKNVGQENVYKNFNIFRKYF